MAKKPDIGSKEFTKLLENSKHLPHKNYIKRIDAKRFSLDLNKVYNYKPELLAIKEFNRCLDLFYSRNPGLSPNEAANRTPAVQVHITKIESNHKAQLEELAINTIRDIYDVPSYVDMKGFIQPRLSLDTEQDHNPDSFLNLTLEQKNNMRDEIQKRVILNGLVHGSSMHVWKGIYHMVSSELDAISPELKELYNYYTSTLGIQLWLMDPDEFQDSIQEGNQMTQGFNELKFDKEKGFGGQIKAKAINFPVLLHELNKGVIDWLISGAIPKEYSEEELKYYYSKSDTYENEVYHYTLSPSLWSSLLDVVQLENHDLPVMISKLVKLSYPELVELFKSIIDEIESGKIIAKKYKLI
jgi:hypothetical protein